MGGCGEGVSYGVAKLGNLIQCYLDSLDGAKINFNDKYELSQMIIEGEDLIPALKYIHNFYQSKIEGLEEKEENYEKLVGELETLVEGKTGSFPDKIRDIIN